MSIFGKLFGSKNKQATAPTQSASSVKQAPNASRTSSPTPSPSDAAPEPDLPQRLLEGMRKITEFEVTLLAYFKEHPTPENEMLVLLASNLSVHNLELLSLLKLPTGGLNDVEIKRLIAHLETCGEVPGIGPPPLISELQELLQKTPHLVSTPESRAKLEAVVARRLRNILNVYYEFGRKHLIKRDMEAHGLPDGLVARAMETAEIEEVFELPKRPAQKG